jgi:glutaredoxin
MANVKPKDKPMVYALSTCPYCKRTKRFLDTHKIEYDVIDVDLLDDTKQDEVIDKVEKITGRRSFPVVIVGEVVIVGHDEEKLKKALKL